MADGLQAGLLPAVTLMAMPLQPPMPIVRILLHPWLLLIVSLTLKVQCFEAELSPRARRKNVCSNGGIGL